MTDNIKRRLRALEGGATGEATVFKRRLRLLTVCPNCGRRLPNGLPSAKIFMPDNGRSKDTSPDGPGAPTVEAAPPCSTCSAVVVLPRGAFSERLDKIREARSNEHAVDRLLDTLDDGAES